MDGASGGLGLSLSSVPLSPAVVVLSQEAPRALLWEPMPGARSWDPAGLSLCSSGDASRGVRRAPLVLFFPQWTVELLSL